MGFDRPYVQPVEYLLAELGSDADCIRVEPQTLPEVWRSLGDRAV